MSESQSETSPAIGLDIGTSRIVAARRVGSAFEFRSELNAFVGVPFSNMVEKALASEGIPFSRSNGTIMVHGNESARFAELLGLDSRRPMTAGSLNSAEPQNTEVIRKIVDTVLGGEDANGRLVYFSVPAEPLDGGSNLTYHEAILKEILTERGFTAKSINEGLAVVYGEMESSNFTGIGISCGGGLSNVCLSYLAVPVVSFSVSKAGDFIDSQAAAVTGDRSTRIRLEKEASFQINGNHADKLLQAIGVYYDDMIQSLVAAMTHVFSQTDRVPRFKDPIPLVLSGGTALPPGFAARFSKVLKERESPVPVAEVRLAKDPLNATAKGALNAALTEI